jgi:hypothetical protein
LTGSAANVAGEAERWDAFISHATEDKAALAIPLADELQERGLRVWLDRRQIDLSDNLRGKVNEGIVRSRFAVVLLSRSYIDKQWTIDELDAFMAREEAGRRVVLPVLHGVDQHALATTYPLLANRVFANTSDGIPAVADAITRVVLKDGSDSPSRLSPSLGRRFLDVLESGHPEPADVRSFLMHHPTIVSSAVVPGDQATVHWMPELGDLRPDACVSFLQRTAGRNDWTIILLDTLSPQLFDEDSEPVPTLRQSVAHLESLRGWIDNNYEAARASLPDITPSFQGVVLAARRQEMSATHKRQLEEFNDFLVGTRVRTYDWLVDAALAL